MSRSQIDLTYCRFDLWAGWLVKARLDVDFISISLVRGQTTCEISLLSGGSDNPNEVIVDLFTRLLKRAQVTGRSVIDLEEFFDLEFISELGDESDSSGFQHTFLRQCGNIVLLAILKGHSEGDDDEVRQMLSSFRLTSERTNVATLERLPKGNLFNDWDRVGNIASTTGVQV